MDHPEGQGFYDAGNHTSTKQKSDAQVENSPERSKKTIKYPENPGHENYSSNMKEQDPISYKILNLNS
jgi:hypothetical protein